MNKYAILMLNGKEVDFVPKAAKFIKTTFFMGRKYMWYELVE